MDNPDRDILLKHIGRIVKTHREKQGLTQFDLGLEVGKSGNQIGRIERAESNPTTKTLLALANFFGIHVNEFFDIDEEGNSTH